MAIFRLGRDITDRFIDQKSRLRFLAFRRSLRQLELKDEVANAERVSRDQRCEVHRLAPEQRTVPGAQVLEALPVETPLNVELKRREADPERLVARLALDLDRRDRVLVSSFDWELLALVRCLLPEQLLAPIGRRSADELLLVADELGAWSVHCHRRLASEVVASGVSARPVLAYTVNDADEARRLLKLGVSGLFTNAPGRLRAELEA